VINAFQMLKSPLQTPGPIEKATPPPASRARLVAFVLDGESETSLTSCLAQLAVAPPMIRRGGLAGAIRYLGAERSPESIIVDISGAEMPASQIHELADLCEPGVVVIAIGDRNDVALYRDLVRAGVSEYIVKPVTAQLLAKSLIGDRPRVSEVRSAGSSAKSLPSWGLAEAWARQPWQSIWHCIWPIVRAAVSCS